jgi:hypothetical protein
MEDGHEQSVRFRLDNGPITKQTWGIADSLDALFLPRSVIKRLGKSKSLVVQYSPEYQTPETETFDLDGLGEAEAKAGCKL